MELRITQYREAAQGVVRFVVRGQLLLEPREQVLITRYGAPPLTHPPLDDDDDHPLAVLTGANALQELTMGDYTYRSNDVRRALAFVEKLRTACSELGPYWEQAAAFEQDRAFPF